MNCWRWGATALIALDAHAHGFDERYDLPVPLPYVVIGACLVVALTFIVSALFLRPAPTGRGGRWWLEWEAGPTLQRLVRGVSWWIFMVTLAAALTGSGDPLMNLAPTMIWIIGWLGIAFLSGLVGGVWTLIDPWRTSFELLDSLVRRLGASGGLSLGWRWPRAVGQWPAVAQLLLWCALEVIAPLASAPFKLGCVALLWTLCSVLGMAAFGRDTWQRYADMFALVFDALGRIAPVRLRGAASSHGPQVPFVMAMLATVIFDGLHGGQAWTEFEQALGRVVPQALDVNGIFAGATGLLLVWLGFWLVYSLSLRLFAVCLRADGLGAPALVITLVPIALAYQVAHNFSSLLIQGQRIFQLLSDPFGWQWDLFGTARWYPDSGIVDARMTWFVALTAIVAGHMVSIWWAHRLVLAAGVTPRRAFWAMLPLSLLMVGYTAISLVLIAEPMVNSAPMGPSASMGPPASIVSSASIVTLPLE